MKMEKFTRGAAAEIMNLVRVQIAKGKKTLSPEDYEKLKQKIEFVIQTETSLQRLVWFMERLADCTDDIGSSEKEIEVWKSAFLYFSRD